MNEDAIIEVVENKEPELKIGHYIVWPNSCDGDKYGIVAINHAGLLAKSKIHGNMVTLERSIFKYLIWYEEEKCWHVIQSADWVVK
jgi:hypothetical protein